MSPPEIFVTVRELQELVPTLMFSTICFSIVGVFLVIGVARSLVALFDFVSLSRKRRTREASFSRDAANDWDIPY